MIIDCVSDLHGSYPQLDGGDLLIIAGDLTAKDCLHDYDNFYDWLALQEYKFKIYIAGNHDVLLSNYKVSTPKYCDARYLCDSGIEFGGLKIWGSPWTLRFKGENPHCTAHTCFSEKELSEKWALVDSEVNILVTHSPSWGILDQVVNSEHAGSVSLMCRCGNLKNLKVHVSGHIHEAYGKVPALLQIAEELAPKEYIAINASHVNERYEPVNRHIRIVL